MRVLITGGAGYLGTELTYALASRNDVTSVVVLDNLSRGNYNLFIGKSNLNDKIRFVNADILDSRKIREVLSDIDTVYHLAARVTTPFSDQNPHFFEQTNNWGSAELVYALEESNVKHLVYLSSVSVYGASSDEVDTNSPTDPKTFYGISKKRGEEHAGRLLNKIKTHIIRCGNVYGYSKSMRFDAVINKFMFEANFKGRITVNGNGEQHRSFIHIGNLTSILSNLIDHPLTSGIYNLVDKVLTVNDIAETVQSIYPKLEMLFVNQHVSLRELKVKSDTVINDISTLPYHTLEQELKQFKVSFTF